MNKYQAMMEMRIRNIICREEERRVYNKYELAFRSSLFESIRSHGKLCPRCLIDHVEVTVVGVGGSCIVCSKRDKDERKRIDKGNICGNAGWIVRK